MKTLEKEGVPGSQAPHLSSQQKPSLQGGTHSEFGRAGPPGRRVQLQRSLSALSQPRAQARGAEARRGGPRGWWDWAGRGGGPARLPGALSAHWKISRLRVPWSEGLAPRWASVSPSSLTHPGATAAWGDH